MTSTAWIGVFALAVSTAAQTVVPPPQRRAAEVMVATRQLALTAQVADSSTEITVRWTMTPSAGTVAQPAILANAPAGNEFSVVARRTTNASMVRERDPQLADDQLVVIAVSAGGVELGWQLCKDPRIIRAETPTAAGQLRGQVFYRTPAEFVVAVPAGVTAAQFRIYQPAWNGTEFLLTLLGTVANAG